MAYIYTSDNRHIFDDLLDLHIASFSDEDLRAQSEYYNVPLKEMMPARDVARFKCHRAGWSDSIPSRPFFNAIDIHHMTLARSIATHFRITDDILTTLLNTDAPIEPVHLPYAAIYLDVTFEHKGHRVLGILLWDPTNQDNYRSGDPFYAELIKGDREAAKTMAQHGYDIYFVTFDQENEQFSLSSMCLGDFFGTDVIQEGNAVLEEESFRKAIIIFTSSFLHFLYIPEVELVKREYTPIRKKRREEQGRPVHDHYYIKLSGKLRKYVDSLDAQTFSGERLERDHAWIVRGFYRTYRHDRFVNAKGTTEFIPPYVAGLGEPAAREYIATERKKIWQGQRKMQALVQELFPSHLMIPNTRGFLDGLELDAYIPELKIGFEYDGKQHFEHVPVFHQDLQDFKAQQKRDRTKDRLAKERGITLIRIRYDEPLSRELILAKLAAAGISPQTQAA